MIYLNGVAVVGDMFKATYDSDKDGRVEKDALEITLNKLLKGAGAGASPTEIDVPSGATLTVAQTEVFNGAAPTTWTDLNLSATIGANAALVVLKIASATAGRHFAVRKNGDTDEFYSASVPPSSGYGAAIFQSIANIHAVLIVATDASGIIEWKQIDGATCTVDIIAYIK